ncbi:TM0106 family RecB-like putative nuclease [Stagnihabitans tardus]|uniref:TM0106 family RecB-like putative nuclease n=1 Tax=Stagnihabitans tardus TaxID=2699202 RepID=A0AAE5BRD9_9RHOB|nr:TM0106 family RecB-like putative nuclease [Stagnihabitans tardus]NBZ86450.1 TM0106 family RecB-like putative nuclease [Stagnihabitans tardus]
MRDIDGRLLFSASDLMRFMGCAHATTLDLARLRGQGPEPRADSADAALLQAHGDAHEQAHLGRLKAQGAQVVEMPRGELFHDAEATRAVLARGPEVVFQGALQSGNWGGWSDFLVRVPRPSALGDFSYEVTDTKLKRRPHPSHVLQLVLYSDLLAQVQGLMPAQAHVELGDGSRATLRLADYAAYARAARTRLEAFAAAPPRTRPLPCAACALCRWADHCADRWRQEDSLFTLAGISRTQVKRLEAKGIATVEALACAPDRGDRLQAQARLQHARKTGAPAFQLRPPEPGRGFALLPAPQEGDLFYDIEGDPHVEGGLEYLHGVWTEGRFHAFWAHDHAAEARALTDLLAFFRAWLTRFPKARIYHYAPYEITALRRLTTKYGQGEAFLDRLLREGRFVDLYAVVRGGIVTSEPSYSIKSLEVFYGLKRSGEVKTAGGSVVAYEAWRESGDDAILAEILDYNRVDCVSTEGLRDWLVTIRPEAPWPSPGEDRDTDEAQEDAEASALRAQLAHLPEDRARMLFDLGMFHRREAKPAWWAIFDSLTRDDEALIEDLDALGGLRAVGPLEPVKRSFARTYDYPPQETKLRPGKSPVIPAPEGFSTATVEALDRAARRITLKVGAAKKELLADTLTLHPEKPIGAEVIAEALRDVVADQCGPRAYRAVDDLLSARAPRLSVPMPGGEPVAATIAAVQAMEETVLPIQGPPGTGKTHVTARAILALVRQGARVGVASSSHEAITNVLTGCLKALSASDPDITLAHKIGTEDGYPEGSPIHRATANDDAVLGRAQVVGGTAWFFCRPENVQAFDWLFVDEAGQVGLANMAAMGRAARNLVLVGDPQQLPQVIQGAHPDPVGQSCLEWLAQGAATLDPSRGIFLGTSRRMHPAVCGFISEQVYDGRLTSHPDTALQAVEGWSPGAFWVPVAHEGNAQVAPEEVAAIKATVARLTGAPWTDAQGTRPLREADIIVVAPYNAQVNALRAALPDTIRVGTVDKFQGQEAPVCLVSMTASSVEETPRGMEFLFSLNRMNVAISRAKALALVFGAPALRAAKCETIDQMRLVNTLCALPDGPGEVRR